MSVNHVKTAQRQKLSADDIRQIEIDIDSGSLEAMASYAGDATRYFSDDIDELNRRKRKLFAANHNGYAPILQCIAILAAMTDDHDTWELVIETFGEHVPPKLGYYTFQQLKKQRGTQERLGDWFYILEFSANKGFLLARRDVARDRLKRFGVSGLVPFYLYRFWLTLVAIRLVIKDSRDPRLPLID